MAIDPSQADQVASALLAYLADHLGVAGLRFAEPPQPIGRGFDTYIYAFRLEGDGLDSAWAGRSPTLAALVPTVAKPVVSMAGADWAKARAGFSLERMGFTREKMNLNI